MDIEDYPQIRNFWDFEKNTIDPQSVSPGSNISAFWKCRKCGYEWKSTINARKSRTDQCPCCDRNQVVIKGINDVFTLVKMRTLWKGMDCPSCIPGCRNSRKLPTQEMPAVQWHITEKDSIVLFCPDEVLGC